MRGTPIIWVRGVILCKIQRIAKVTVLAVVVRVTASAARVVKVTVETSEAFTISCGFVVVSSLT